MDTECKARLRTVSRVAIAIGCVVAALGAVLTVGGTTSAASGILEVICGVFYAFYGFFALRVAEEESGLYSFKKQSLLAWVFPAIVLVDLAVVERESNLLVLLPVAVSIAASAYLSYTVRSLDVSGRTR